MPKRCVSVELRKHKADMKPLAQRHTHAQELLQGLNSLREQEKLFDVTLVVEGRHFKAHRAVLAACSDYFSAMFTDAMRESSQTEIALHGVTARGIELLIDYAYTSTLDISRGNVEDLLAVSTHVQMRSVIERCSRFLESQIDLENVVVIAALADMYSLCELRRLAYGFLCARLARFSQTADFLSLSIDQLRHILSCSHPVDCTEARVLELSLEYCLAKAVPPELAQRLFEKVRLAQLPAKDFDDVVAALTNSSDSVEVAAYADVLRLEWQQQTQRSCEEGAPEVVPTKVLINSRGMEQALVKIGGFETNGLTNQISVYLRSIGKWTTLTMIPHIEQCNFGTAVLNNVLYVVGGSYDVCLKEYIHPFGFKFCPIRGDWKNIAPIQADRCRFSLNAMGDNFLYAVGGVCELNENGGNLPVSNCERYDSATDRWEYFPALPEHRSQHAGVVVGQRLYISGGLDRLVLGTFWCFDTVGETWQKLQAMPTPRADHILIAFDECIYACGGWYEDPLTETRVLAENIDVYDIGRNEWRTETQNPMPKFYTGISALRRKFYFIGGLHSTATINRATSAVQSYNLDTKEWRLETEWEYPNEVWECACAAFYVSRETPTTRCVDLDS